MALTIRQCSYKLLKYRYTFVPQQNFKVIHTELDNRMKALGHPLIWNVTDENRNDPRSVGVQIAETIINECKDDVRPNSESLDVLRASILWFLKQAAAELLDYVDGSYYTSNPPIAPTLPESIIYLVDPNHWQSVALGSFIDQNGISLKDFPPFTGPQWGRLKPYAMTETDRTPLKSGVWFDLPGPSQLPWSKKGEDKTDTPMTEEGEWYRGNHSYASTD